MKLTGIPIALLALLAGTLALPSVAHAEGWFSDLHEVKEVTLGEVLRNPRQYLDVEIKVKVYFDRVGRNYNPYFTRFSDMKYGNFTAWPMDARLYNKRDFERSYPFFFVDKDSGKKLWKKVSSLDRVTPIEIRGFVRDVFRAQPWIEVTSYSTESSGLRADDVRNVVAGDAYFLAGRYGDAIQRYRAASRHRFPAAVQADVYRKLADANFRAGKFLTATRTYKQALRYAPDSAVLNKALAASRQMYERSRGRSQDAGTADVPARSEPVVAGQRTDVDDIIDKFEDAATVQAEADRGRLDLQKRATQAQVPEDAAAVSGEAERPSRKKRGKRPSRSLSRATAKRPRTRPTSRTSRRPPPPPMSRPVTATAWKSPVRRARKG